MITAAAPPIAIGERAEQPLDRLLRTVSASRLNTFHQCRLKFYFRYVKRILKPPSPALHVGKVLHAVLQEWNKARWRKEPFSAEKAKELFDVLWLAEQQNSGPPRFDQGNETAEHATGWKLLQTYFTQTPIADGERPEAVEVHVEANLANYGLPTLIGIIDLVRAGRRVVDFKTSARTPGQAEHQHELQLSCYGVLYRDATGTKEAGLELHHLIKTKTPKIVITELDPISPSQEARLFRSIDSYVMGLQRQDFVPSPGLHCTSCEYFAECRAWTGEVSLDAIL